MSPLLEILMNETDCPINTEESRALMAEIKSMQEIIQKELSFEFLDRYSVLCNRCHDLECDAYFERGFFPCAQPFIEMLSRYSS